jgi:hypothetical protein
VILVVYLNNKNLIKKKYFKKISILYTLLWVGNKRKIIIITLQKISLFAQIQAMYLAKKGLT